MTIIRDQAFTHFVTLPLQNEYGFGSKKFCFACHLMIICFPYVDLLFLAEVRSMNAVKKLVITV